MTDKPEITRTPIIQVDPQPGFVPTLQHGDGDGGNGLPAKRMFLVRRWDVMSDQLQTLHVTAHAPDIDCCGALSFYDFVTEIPGVELRNVNGFASLLRRAFAPDEWYDFEEIGHECDGTIN
jgi:hypothetical protein